MNVLHIGHISNRQQSGVSTVVPKHLLYQSRLMNVALLNLVEFTPIDSSDFYSTFFYKEMKDICQLPAPFDAPDLVVFHEIYRTPFISLSRQLNKRKIPYVVMPHGSLSTRAQEIRKWKKVIGNGLFFGSFVRSASAIHFGSDYEKNNALSSMVGSIKPIVIGSGVDIHDTIKQKFHKDGLDVIYIGRLDIEVKGLDLLIEAVAQIKDYMIGNNIRITLVGPDEDHAHRNLLQSITDHNIADLVTVQNALYGHDKTKRILASDCFIQLSRTESQCLGLMEAMGMGLPSIATPGTTLYELMKRHEIGFPVKGEAESIASMIIYVNEHRGLFPVMSEKAASFVKRNYSWDHIAKMTAQAYGRVERG